MAVQGIHQGIGPAYFPWELQGGGGLSCRRERHGNTR